MSTFTRSLILEETGGGVYWTVFESLTYFVGSEDGDEYVPVPKGTTTDLASVPRLLRAFVPKDGKGHRAFVVHDVLYRRGFVCVRHKPGARGYREIKQKEADRIALEAMKVLGVSKSRQYAIYYGLRIGGWVGWRQAKHKRATNLAYYRLHGEVMAA